MIRLDVEEYCNTCPEFKATILYKDVTTFTDGFGSVISTKVNGDIMVGCALKETCANIKRHFEALKD